MTSLRSLQLLSLVLGLAASACIADYEELTAEELDMLDQELLVPGVTFQTVGVPRYLGAQNNGGSTVNATANAAQTWETFTLDDINGGALVSGDSVFIRTGNGQYFQAVNGGGSTLNAASTNRLGWETFRIVKESGSGVINNGDVVGIQASNGRFVRALNGGGSTVDAQGAALGGWERLRIGGLGSTQPSACSGIQSGAACCPSSCGACGGTGCGDRPGGSNACCTGPILSSGVSCSGNAPPCIVTGSTPPPPPPASCSGIQNGAACCPSSCGACGGTGCGDRPGGSNACCTGPILSSGVSCSGNAPPCIVTGSTPPPPAPSPGREIFRAHFQNQSLGTYSQAKVAADFGSSASWNNGLSQGRASVVQEGTNKFLRVTYPANKFGPNEGGVQFEVDLKGRYQELFFSYRVRFASGFNFVKGGKLPGLVGGSSPSGCTTDLTGGFSARNMWRGGGQAEQYMYYPDRSNRCGDDWNYSGGTFVPGRWHTMEHRIVMGTSGQSNGIMQGWMDGRLALNRTLKWKVSGATYGIDKMYFSTFFGGSDQSWAPTSAQRVDFDDLVVSDRPISH